MLYSISYDQRLVLAQWEGGCRIRPCKGIQIANFKDLITMTYLAPAYDNMVIFWGLSKQPFGP